jgi:hypothetical protein
MSRLRTKTTLNKNSKFVPSIVKDQGRLYSSLFYENTSGIIVASYQGKVNKNVNLISTLHDYVAVDDSVKKKPKLVVDYNKTKTGIDTLDQMNRIYSVKSATRR